MSYTNSAETAYFPDGNIILSLPSHCFRLSKELLKTRSGVFSDLFLTVKEGAPGREEVPIIDLHDEEEPFLIFLHALHGNDLHVFFPKYSKKTAGLVAQILDLGDKYDVDVKGMQHQLFAFIERDWPPSLDGWDANEAEIKAIQTNLESELDPKHPILYDQLDNLLPDPATVIHLARKHPLAGNKSAPPPFLAAAFYHLSRIPPFADPDSPYLSSGDFYDLPGLRTARRSLLTPRDLHCLQEGIYHMRKHISALAFREFIDEVHDGSDAIEPENGTKVMLDWWTRSAILKFFGPDACDRPDLLQGLQEIIDILTGVSSDELGLKALYTGTTLDFRERMAKYLRSERQRIWEGLENTFFLASFFD